MAQNQVTSRHTKRNSAASLGPPVPDKEFKCAIMSQRNNLFDQFDVQEIIDALLIRVTKPIRLQFKT